MKLGIITGFVTEMKVLKRLSPHVACAGGVAERAQAFAREMVERGCDALLSCGIAGGLSPDLHPGDVVIGRKVRSVQGLMVASTPLCDYLAERLPHAQQGVVAATEEIVDTPVIKRSLHRTYGALTVDMESWGVARAAIELGVPFAVLRIVADPSHRVLPPAALVGMDEGGQVHPWRVIRSLLQQPWQLTDLIRVALDTNKALSSLSGVVERLN